MQQQILKIVEGLIWFSLFGLAIITPLLFSTQNTELFEVPKMLFVYFAAVIILFLTLIKFVLNGKITIPKSWPLATLFIFIIIQIFSTFTSIDKFTSIFGYPSRLNGGLISQLAYLVIFACALINLTGEQIKKTFIAIVIAAFAVSLWGIPSHFGKDPSCYVLTGKLTSSCWQEDFNPRLRIFSTLGQPNWLATYLVLTIPLSLALSLMATRIQTKAMFSIVTLTLFVAFIFTNSRSGALGLVIALAIFIALMGIQIIKKNLKILAILIAAFLAAGIFLGSKLLFRVDDTIKIRQIVWQGAIEIFKKKPLLGTGPETFAYSYYLYRPLAHNQTAEWNFFYNKAHNEFLNYLANIGILGFVAYLLFMATAIVSLKTANRHLRGVESFHLGGGRNSPNNFSLAKATIAAITGYQVSIFFGFSTVASQLLMYLMLAQVLAKEEKKFSFKLNLNKNSKVISSGVLIIFGLVILSFPTRMYFADLFLSRASNLEYDDANGAIESYQNAILAFPVANPFYLSSYSYFLAQYIATIDDQNTVSSLTKTAIETAQLSQNLSPNNLIVQRRVANIYLLIASYNKDYQPKALEVGQNLIKLAPTDPQSYYSLAKIQVGIGKEDDAKETLVKTLELKPDYQEAKELFQQLTTDN